MPVIAGKVTMPVAPSEQNIAIGSQYEQAPFDAEMEVALKTDRDLVTATVFSGPDILAEPGMFVPKGASGEPPRVPDDYHVVEKIAKGDRIKVSLKDANTSGNSVVYFNIRLTAL